MLSKEEIEKIEQARSNILRGTDLESSALILEKAILDNYIFIGDRVNILHLAVRQILYFIENSKIKNVGDKSILDYVKENVTLKKRAEQLETKEQKIIEKLEKRRKQNNNRYGQAIDGDDFPEMYEYSGQVKEDDYILSIIKGEEKNGKM